MTITFLTLFALDLVSGSRVHVRSKDVLQEREPALSSRARRRLREMGDFEEEAVELYRSLAKSMMQASPQSAFQSASLARARSQSLKADANTRVSDSVMKEKIPLKDARVTILGSGNFGSAVAKLVAENVKRYDQFNDEVTMYVYDEKLESGESIVEYINREHENCKYLPGVKLPENIVAEPDLLKAAQTGDVLVWVAPHQFVLGQAKAIKDVIKRDVVTVSLVKGGFDIEEGKPKLLSEQLAGVLGLPHDASAVLMGANLANEIADGQFAEATLGCAPAPDRDALQKIFNNPTFKVNAVSDVEAVETCGALKNVVALATGFSDGLGMGNNAKAAIVRNGLMEMRAFIEHFYPETHDLTFFESCGVADLITTCYGGRNRMCAEEFARSKVSGNPKSWDQVSKELLNGQMLQGTLTIEEIMPIIKANKFESTMPLFVAVHKVAFEDAHPNIIFDAIATVKNE